MQEFLSSRRGKMLVWAVLGGVAGKGIIGFLFAMMEQLTASLLPDILNYFAAGRAMLNGLDPYIDVYESKPPGVLLIVAASLHLTGTQSFAAVLQIIVLLAVPVFTVLFAQYETRGMPTGRRHIAMAAALFFGLLLGHYTTLRGGNLYTESFGTAFGLAYLWVVIKAGDKPFRWKSILLAGVFFMLATFMKEPFALVLCASAWLLQPRFKSWIRHCIVPGAVAFVLFIASLFSLGLARSYFVENLPQLFGKYSMAVGSPWLFGFNVTPIAKDLWMFSPAFALTFAVAILCHLATAPAGKRLRTLGASLLIIAGPFLVLIALFALAAWHGLPFNLHGVLRLPELAGDSTLPLLWSLTFVAMLLIYAGLRMLWSVAGFADIRRTLLMSAALYAGILVMGMRGKYYPHHLAITIPLYCTLFVLLIRWMKTEQGSAAGRRMGALLTIILAIGVLAFPIPNPYWNRLMHGHETEMPKRVVAANFDRLLDSCGFERFFAYGWEEETLWGYTTHTPYGSSYNNMVWWLDRNVPSYMERFQERLAETPLIVTEKSRLPELDHDLGVPHADLFTTNPPACAKPFMPIAQYTVLFRK